MNEPDSPSVREFLVITDFQRAARRPGGISKDEALRTAIANIDQLKPRFASWLEKETQEIKLLIVDQSALPAAHPSFIEEIEERSNLLAESAETLGYVFVSFIAANLRKLCMTIRAGAPYHSDIIACYADALILATQQKYASMTPGDLPALSEGLERLVESRKLNPQTATADPPSDLRTEEPK